jgi:hypothetical protein
MAVRLVLISPGSNNLARVLVLAAGALAAAPAADAALPAGNLVLNPGAEDGPGASDGSTVIPPPSWTTTGTLTALQYGADGGSNPFPSFAVRDAIGGGANFISGGSGGGSTGTQTYDVSGAAPEIDARGVVANLSGYLGGFEAQPDNAEVDAAFLDGSGTILGSVSIGPVTPAERAGQPERTTLLPRSAKADVPAGTRAIRLTLTTRRLAGSRNDGYADNLSLMLIGPPVIGRTANAEAERGTVLVKLPNGGGFVPLEQARQLPVGTVFDTTEGAVGLTTAGSGTSQGRGTFGGGMFAFEQTRKNPLTTIVMRGGRLSSCKARGRASKRRRTLFSNVRGRFRTRGRNSAATVRGTAWRMTDTCAGTRTSVQTGSVVVRDFRLRKNKVVRAGRSYFARAGR